MSRIFALLATIALLSLLTACDNSGDDGSTASNGTHTHADGPTHADDADETSKGEVTEADQEGEDHAHDETSLGRSTIGDIEVELAQGHGAIEAGMEGHLVVKLPYTDNGATIVRAWIGVEDRTLSMVGRGAYASSHDDYDIHAMAPDPLAENAMWWIEIEKPDGAKVIGSAKPIMD